MGSRLLSAAAFVHLNVFVCIDRQWAIWVDCDQEESGVRLSFHKVSRRYLAIQCQFNQHRSDQIGI